MFRGGGGGGGGGGHACPSITFWLATPLIQTAFVAPIVLSELVFYNNTQGIWFPSLDARDSDTLLTMSNSSFTNNGNGGIVCAVLSENSGKKLIL